MARLKKNIIQKPDKYYLGIMYRDGGNYKTYFGLPVDRNEYIEVMGQEPVVGAEFECEQLDIDPELVWDMAHGYDEELDHNILEIIDIFDSEEELEKNGYSIHFVPGDRIFIGSGSLMENKRQLNETLTSDDIKKINNMIQLKGGRIARSEVEKLSKEIKPKQREQEKINKDIDRHFKDKEQHLTIKDVEKIARDADSKIEKDIEKSIKTELEQIYKDRNFEKSVQDIVTDTLVNFYRTMWVKRGFWQNNLVK